MIPGGTATRKWRDERILMWSRFAVTTFAVLGSAIAGAGESPRCPDLAGHYRIDGFGPVLGDALEALNLSSAGFQDSEVKLAGSADTALSFWIKVGKTGVMGNRPSLVLTRGIDDDCVDGAVVLKHGASSGRQTQEGWLEGRSIVRLAPDGRGGLGLGTEFHGRQRTTLYSYDSARISVPKLGTARTLAEGIRWPNIREPRPVSETYVPAPESAQVLAMRQMLDATLLGGVTLGGLKDSDEGVLASLSTPRSNDVVAFEDRLRDAAIFYQVKRSPIWSSNQYSLQFLFAAEGAEKRSWHPSEFRVQHEIERMQHPMISVSKVEDTADGYLATLSVIGPESVETILQRLRLNTTMFGKIEVLDDTPHPSARNLRIVRLRLSLP